jgi:DNA topoisomerase-1
MEPEIKISPKKIKHLIHDSVKSAKAANLIYVSDAQAGILRIRQNDTFVYRYNNRLVRDKASLTRIQKLVIPPAWENVWICKEENGHIQVTGIDQKNRKQYRYHPLWNSLRNQTKFFHMWEFGHQLSKIRRQVHKDLALPGIPQEKVLATVVSLMESTNIRIGSNAYEKLYGSFGLSTLKDKHVKIDGAAMKFIFKGKKGVSHEITIRNKRLANIVQKCRDIPGKELFQYIDEHQQRRSIDSGMVNNYLKNICGAGFTAKDFRTWNGTMQALLCLKNMDCGETEAITKKNIVAALDEVSRQLGNTRTVCRKYYVHPVILSLYENQKLAQYQELDGSLPGSETLTGLTAEEKILMHILAQEGYSL